jgi:putative tryptophan/tyrosine transport system substrate-binding protein
MTKHIRRREIISLLGGVAAAWPIAARAQQPAMPVIGFLDSTTAAARVSRVAGFRQGLSEAGFIEGRNVAPIEFRFAENQIDRLPALAADLVRRQVAVIFAAGPTIRFARAATSKIPIVFITGSDPVETGVVTSLNRPGGNITGVSFNNSPVNPKRLEMLHELVPKPAIIVALVDVAQTSSQPDAESRALEAAALALGRQILILRTTSGSEIDAAFATMVRAGAGGLFVGAGPFYLSQGRQLVTLAARHALPASYGGRELVVAGGLMSYAASSTDASRRAGFYVGRILKGEKPGDLPVEFPTRYELVFNLATARALKIDIPAKLLALADELIE